MKSQSKTTYVWMELENTGLKFAGYADSWLCPWTDYHHFLTEYLERLDIEDTVGIKFTVLEMDDAEYEAFIRDNDIEMEE